MTVARIDPTARVAAGAALADDVEVGPFCTVGPKVELRAGVRLLSHVNVAGVTIIGEGTHVHPFASLGTEPQSNAYRDSPTRLVIGNDCRIREGVTINTGTEDGGGITTVGDRCFLMANSHVAHDCVVGNNVTFANNAVIGGHVRVADHVFIGGNTSVLQFVRIGEGAMLGGSSGVTCDVIPYGFAFGLQAELVGLNVVGLKRRGHSRDEMRHLRRAYRVLFFSDGTFAQRLDEARRAFAGDPLIEKILSFICDARSKPLMMPAKAEAAATSEADE